MKVYAKTLCAHPLIIEENPLRNSALRQKDTMRNLMYACAEWSTTVGLDCIFPHIFYDKRKIFHAEDFFSYSYRLFLENSSEKSLKSILIESMIKIVCKHALSGELEIDILQLHCNAIRVTR